MILLSICGGKASNGTIWDRKLSCSLRAVSMVWCRYVARLSVFIKGKVTGFVN